MKRTIISYKKLDQHKVKIIGFKNAANRDEIEVELGLPGKKEYLNNGLSYYQWGNGIVIKRDDYRMMSGHVGTILPGVIFTAVKFWALINTMKEAGNRFAQVKDHYQAQKVYEVKI